MPTLIYEITSYRLRFLGTSSFLPASEENKMAQLLLFGPARFGTLAFIDFYRSNALAAKQDRVENPSNPMPALRGNMSISEIGAVMDMLRTEKPIYVWWSDSYQQVILDMNNEPTGEEES